MANMQDMINWYAAQGYADPAAAAQADWNQNVAPQQSSTPTTYGVANDIRALPTTSNTAQQQLQQAYQNGDYASAYNIAMANGMDTTKVAQLLNVSPYDVSAWTAQQGYNPLANDPVGQMQSWIDQGPGDDMSNYKRAYAIAAKGGYNADWLGQQFGMDPAAIRQFGEQYMTQGLNGYSNLPPVTGAAKQIQDAYLSGDYTTAANLAQQNMYTVPMLQNLTEIRPDVIQGWLDQNGYSLPSSLNPGAKYNQPTYANGSTTPAPLPQQGGGMMSTMPFPGSGYGQGGGMGYGGGMGGGMSQMPTIPQGQGPMQNPLQNSPFGNMPFNNTPLYGQPASQANQNNPWATVW